MIVSYNIYSLLWKTLTKGKTMKKFILLIALSALLYSAPGYTMPGGDEETKAARGRAPSQAAELLEELKKDRQIFLKTTHAKEQRQIGDF